MLLGERIKELREQHGVLQRQLATLFEIPPILTNKISITFNRYVSISICGYGFF